MLRRKLVLENLLDCVVGSALLQELGVVLRQHRDSVLHGREGLDLSVSMPIFWYRYTGISNPCILVRICPVPVFPTPQFQDIYTKCPDFRQLSGVSRDSGKIY